MDDLILEPYAVILNFSFPNIQDRWEELLSLYLISIARESTNNRKAVIGHIKALAVFPGSQYFQMSVIAPDIPPTREGQIPPGSTELEITLNVLVYGISRAKLAEIIRLKADEIASAWNGTIVSGKWT